MSKATIYGLAALLVILPLSASAAIVIDVGDYQLLPNTPDQVRDILVTGTDQVQGLNFYSQVASGSSGPIISDVDIIGTDTIFFGNNVGMTDLDGSGNPDAAPQWEGRTTTTAAGTVLADGLLARMTFDTTGLFNTDSVITWDLLLSGTLNGSTDFAGTAASITNGTLFFAIPEPSTVVIWLVLGMAGACFGGCRRWRSR